MNEQKKELVSIYVPKTGDVCPTSVWKNVLAFSSYSSFILYTTLLRMSFLPIKIFQTFVICSSSNCSFSGSESVVSEYL